MRFFLGTHEPGWLARTKTPLFVSYTRLRRYKTLPRAVAHWALDSGAFTELLNHGHWTISARTYADDVRRMSTEIGKLEWASIQDWICAPAVLARTTSKIDAHQRRTVENYHALKTFAPEVPWLPVLQGWTAPSYLTHLRMYRSLGLLQDEPLIGVGSLASRQQSEDVPKILTVLKDQGLSVHAFGLSLAGLKNVSGLISSADSMVWSFTARRRQLKHDACRARHRICNNCLSYAIAWRRHVLRRLRLAG